MELPTDVRFVGIPGIFVTHYIRDIDWWLKNFQSVGPRFKLWLRRDPTGDAAIIGDGSDAMKMVPIIRNIVTLRAIPLRAFRQESLVITPIDEKTGKIIQKHSDDLQALYDEGDPRKWDVPLLGEK